MTKKKDSVEVITHKTWESVEFRAVRTHAQGTETVTVELEYNHSTGRFKIYQEHQEMVRFDEDTIERADMRAQAVTAAVEYLKSIVKKK